jgi:antitoxin component of RelBE/YafQ-DinJ toxin-antitoxin module
MFVMPDSASTLTIRVPLELKQAAESVARDRDTTLSQLIRAFLRDYVAKERQLSFLGDDGLRTKSRK